MIPEIVTALREGGRVDRLVLAAEDYDEATARQALAAGEKRG